MKGLFVLICLAGCATKIETASDPVQRYAYFLSQYPDTPPETLALIRRGEVRAGMTMSQVEAALGPPHYYDNFYRHQSCWTYLDPFLFLCFDDWLLYSVETKPWWKVAPDPHEKIQNRPRR